MTPRERMMATFAYRNPDRMPLYYHPSEAGLYVHGQRLLDLFHQYPPDNPITFDRIPAPPPGTVDQQGQYSEERTDEWGIRWAYKIFGIQGHAIGHPFATWREGLSHPLPPVPRADDPALASVIRQNQALRSNYYLIDGWVTLFLQMYALRPMEELLVDLVGDDTDWIRYLDRMTVYWQGVVDFLIAKGTDVVMFGDDWATQLGPMVSPVIFRTHFKPRYQELFDRIHRAGRKVFFHCCGKMDYVLDDLLAMGIDGLWPQLGLYDGEQLALRCRDAGVTLFLHPDRQRLIPMGTPAEIREAIARYAERHHRLGGGGIFYVEIENDAPFANVEALFTAIDRYR